MNDYQGALADYNQAILLQPEISSDAYYSRANLKYTKLNDRAGAIQDFRQAARLSRKDGDSQVLQKVIDQLRLLGVSE
jgi:tetratricopeptide (TPR) repeat protein